MPIFDLDFLLILFHHLVRSAFTFVRLEVGLVSRGKPYALGQLHQCLFCSMSC